MDLFFDDNEWSGIYFESGNKRWFQIYHSCKGNASQGKWGFNYYSSKLYKECVWCYKKMPEELRFSLDILCKK